MAIRHLGHRGKAPTVLKGLTVYIGVKRPKKNDSLRLGVRKRVWGGEESKCPPAAPGAGVSSGLLNAQQLCAAFSKLTTRLWD